MGLFTGDVEKTVSNFGYWNEEFGNVDTRGLSSSMPTTQRGCEEIRNAARDAKTAGKPVVAIVDGKRTLVHADGTTEVVR